MEVKNSRVISLVKKDGLKVSRDCERKIIRLCQLTYIDKINVIFYLSQINTFINSMKETSLKPTEKKPSIAQQECY